MSTIVLMPSDAIQLYRPSKYPAGFLFRLPRGILRREIAPIHDLRSTAEYRRQVAANLLRQFCNASWRLRRGVRYHRRNDRSDR